MNKLEIISQALNKRALYLAIIFCVVAYYIGNEEHSYLKLLCNIAYGYIAGYIFYIVSVVFPSVEAENRKILKIEACRIKIHNQIMVIESKVSNLSQIHNEREYSFRLNYAIMNVPICRDRQAMREDKPIKPEFLQLFSELNNLVSLMTSTIRELNYNHDICSEEMLSSLKDFSRNYEIEIKPGVLHGESSEGMFTFSLSFINLKKSI